VFFDILIKDLPTPLSKEGLTEDVNGWEVDDGA